MSGDAYGKNIEGNIANAVSYTILSSGVCRKSSGMDGYFSFKRNSGPVPRTFLLWMDMPDKHSYECGCKI